MQTDTEISRRIDIKLSTVVTSRLGSGGEGKRVKGTLILTPQTSHYLTLFIVGMYSKAAFVIKKKNMHIKKKKKKALSPKEPPTLPASPSPQGSSVALTPSSSSPQEYLLSSQREEQVSVV